MRSTYFVLIGNSNRHDFLVMSIIQSHPPINEWSRDDEHLSSFNVYAQDEYNKPQWSNLNLTTPAFDGKEKIHPSLLAIYRMINGLPILKSIADNMMYTGTLEMKIENDEL